MSSQSQGATFGLAAAALFGVSPPLAKVLLPDSSPLLVAGLLYLGAGLGLLAFELLFHRGSRTARREALVRSSDLRLLTGIIVTGGIMGPVLMLWGLQRLSGVVTSLLLNLEAPFTILLSVVFFREHLDKPEAMGAMLIIAAAAVLTYRPGDMRVDVMGFAAVVAACLCWAIDNNLSQRVSLRDPIMVTRIKTLGAGTCTLSLALFTGQSLPRPSVLLAALMLGLFSYGVSLVLDMQALRLLGAAREAGYFASAPFIGALAAVPILGERWDGRDFLATGLMAVGVALLFRAHHSHLHAHAEVLHDHAHVHEDHHDHEHEGGGPMEEPHAHSHYHLSLTHDHPHVSELHHRHEHG